jgi:hypothetical protein
LALEILPFLVVHFHETIPERCPAFHMPFKIPVVFPESKPESAKQDAA